MANRSQSVQVVSGADLRDDVIARPLPVARMTTSLTSSAIRLPVPPPPQGRRRTRFELELAVRKISTSTSQPVSRSRLFLVYDIWQETIVFATRKTLTTPSHIRSFQYTKCSSYAELPAVECTLTFGTTLVVCIFRPEKNRVTFTSNRVHTFRKTAPENVPVESQLLVKKSRSAPKRFANGLLEPTLTSPLFRSPRRRQLEERAERQFSSNRVRMCPKHRKLVKSRAKIFGRFLVSEWRRTANRTAEA